jgi:hypothetical protein
MEIHGPRDLLALPELDGVVRFTELARFAKTFGVPIDELAPFVVDRGTAIEPWKPNDGLSSSDWERVRGAIARLSGAGHWANTILKLLKEIDRLRERPARPKDDA